MWKKQGLIYNVDANHAWNKSHAQVPVADVLTDRLRIYYATRDTQGKSNTSFIEVNKENPKEILYVHDKPLFDFGPLGAFDDSGIMPSSIITVGEKKKYLYYIGWTTRGTVPYQNAVGLAVSEDNGISFKRYSNGPVISVNQMEPYFSGTSYVMQDEGVFKMWYLSCIRWDMVDNRPEPIYNIKYAESSDGMNWNQTGRVAIELEGNEGGLVSASVIKENGSYKMWFGKRKKEDYRTNTSNTYRIGYAESENGIDWVRKDDMAGIELSAEGWDSEMISYPNVIVDSGRKMMFYNGNGFGKSGFGFATNFD